MNRDRRLPFPGDHKDKQTARLLLYKHALSAPIQGYAVTLAGTDPECELSLMRDYLKWPSHRSWIVDKSTNLGVLNALHFAKKFWPEANIKNADLCDVAPELEAIGFANLDFMGAPLQSDNIKCLKLVIPRMLPGSILGFTWLRGREYLDGFPSSKLLWELGRGYEGNERRWAGVTKAIQNISKNTMDLVDRWEYLSNHSPMAVSIFRCRGM